MKKKLLMLIGGSLLSAMFLAGCANDQDPPPNDDVDVENPADQNGDMNGENNDINTDTDGDMMEDDNTPGEDAVEDNLDMQDEDNQDQ